MPQWIAREYLARRGMAKFPGKQLVPARCPLLGYAIRTMMVEGQTINDWFFRVERQPEVGEEAYDKGADILTSFFHRELEKFLDPQLNSTGRDIIECCLQGGTLEEYDNLIPAEPLISDD
jgi:hypothetical protein